MQFTECGLIEVTNEPHVLLLGNHTSEWFLKMSKCTLNNSMNSTQQILQVGKFLKFGNQVANCLQSLHSVNLGSYVY